MIRYPRLSLLAAMSSIAFSAAEAGAGSGPSVLENVLRGLDPDLNDHWTQAGEPLLAYLNQMTSTDVSRAEVDAITDGTKREAWAEWSATKWPAPTPPDEPPADGVARLGDDVLVTFPADQPFDGANEATGKVVLVLPDGSINVRVFAPNGGADQFLTGVRHLSALDGLPEGAAEWNLPTWSALPSGSGD